MAFVSFAFTPEVVPLAIQRAIEGRKLNL